MRIEHVALWTQRLEEMKAFYQRFFDAVPGENYCNPAKAFESCFLSFESGARLELMTHPAVRNTEDPSDQLRQGLVHLAMSTGSRERVLEKTEAVRCAGYRVIGEPRTTGDGYFESVIADPDGNLVEITL